MNRVTDDLDRPNDVETRSDDYQQAVGACQHAVDALHDGRLQHAQALLDEARAAVERAQHEESSQVQHEMPTTATSDRWRQSGRQPRRTVIG